MKAMSQKTKSATVVDFVVCPEQMSILVGAASIAVPADAH
jgi:hypothetical protein